MTPRNKRWQLRNGNQVLRDRYQKELAMLVVTDALGLPPCEVEGE